MKRGMSFGLSLLLMLSLLLCLPASATSAVGVSLDSCDTAVSGVTVDTACKAEGAGSWKLQVTAGAVEAQTAGKTAPAAFSLKDGAVLLWLYADSADAWDAVTVTLRDTAGRKLTWELKKYAALLTPQRWTQLLLPYKEFDAIEPGFAYEDACAVGLSGSGIPDAANLLVDDIRLCDMTAFLREQHGILFYDSFEISSLLWTQYSSDCVSGDSAAILGNNSEVYHNSEYRTDTDAGVSLVEYPLFSVQTPLDFGNVPSDSLDIYVRIKAVGDTAGLGNLRLMMSSYAGRGYDEDWGFQMSPSVVTGDWQRYTSYKNQNFRLGEFVEPVDFTFVQNMRWILLGAKADAQLLIDDFMIVDSTAYDGCENVYVLATAAADGSGKQYTYGEEGVTEPPAATNPTTAGGQPTTTAPAAGKPDDGSVPVWVFLAGGGVLAAGIAVGIVVAVKKKR